MLPQIVDEANVQLLELKVHEFQPQGLTAFCLLSESHLSVHTWPEEEYVGVDLFTCGENCRPEKAIELLIELLDPEESNIRVVERGVRTDQNLQVAKQLNECEALNE